jgi:hypothetical protein
MRKVTQRQTNSIQVWRNTIDLFSQEKCLINCKRRAHLRLCFQNIGTQNISPCVLTFREKYLQETWPLIIKTLNTFGIKCELDLREGSMTVRTSRKTWDPYAIVQGFNFLINLVLHSKLVTSSNSLRDLSHFLKQ